MSQSHSDAATKLDSLLNENLSDTQRKLITQVKNHLHNMGEPEPSELGLNESIDIVLLDIERQHPNTAAFVRSTLNTMENIGA
jgi:hypothetical protein